MLALTACTPDKPAGYTITADIPGLPAGTRVILDAEGVIADTVLTEAGGFVLTGKMESPKLTAITFEIPGKEKDYEIDLMLDNDEYTITAAHADSLPEIDFNPNPFNDIRENNIRITGGARQKEYQEYRDYMFPYELAENEAFYNSFRTDRWKSYTQEQIDSAMLNYENLSHIRHNASDEFALSHPLHVHSAFILAQKINYPFTHTTEELVHIREITANHTDSASLARITEAVEKALKTPRGAMFEDVVFTDKNGKEVKLSDFAGKGKPVFVDFWASWCGPCRAAIPHVRNIYKEYPEQLTVISASIDREKDAWVKAMDEEKMEWAQYLVTEENMKPLDDFYCVRAIPYLILFSGEGNIVYAGSNPKLMDEKLKEIIK